MTNPYEHAFPARQETPEGEPMACTFCGWPEDHPCAVCGHSIHSILPRNCGHHVFDRPSQASPVGEAPRETAVWRCPCGEYETTVLHEDGEARIVSRRTEARQTPSRKETSEAVCATCGHHRAAHSGHTVTVGQPEPSHCASCSCRAFVPRTSEEPTEHLSVGWSTATSEAAEGEWRREPLQTGTSRSFVSWTAPDGDVTVIREDLEQAIARQAAAPLERRIAVLEASVRTLAGTAVAASDEYEAAESRVATLERELAEAREVIEEIADRQTGICGHIGCRNGQHVRACATTIARKYERLARPRSTETPVEEQD